MRRIFLHYHGIPTRKFFLMILFLVALLLRPHCLTATGPITPSGLNTHVSDPIIVGAHTQYNITGGTRSEGGANLFFSFGEFGVPTNNIANFQNTLVNGTFPHTDNILARITGSSGNNPTLSSIEGSIQTTGFANANLFLMNPAGFLFGPNATVNVGGIMTFTTADYLKHADAVGTQFKAVPDPAADALLSTAAVAAFGFLGLHPIAMITFKGGQLTVANGTGVTLVGGDISLMTDSSVVPNVPSSITAHGRSIQLISVAGGGEVAADTGIPAAGMTLGNITLGQGSVLSTVGDAASGNGIGGTMSIRGGQFVASGAQILTSPARDSMGEGGAVTIAAMDSATVTNSTIDTSSVLANGNGGAVSITASKLTLQDSIVRTSAVGDPLTAIPGGGGPVSLAGTSSVSLMNSTIGTDTADTAGNAGAITITTPTLTIQGGLIDTSTAHSFQHNLAGNAGDIEITGTTGAATNVNLTDFATLQSFASSPNTSSQGGIIRITATENILVANGTSILTTTASQANAGNIEMVSKHVTIMGQSVLGSETLGPGGGGSIKITGTENIATKSGSIISTNSAFAVENQGPAGHIEFNTQQLTVTGGSLVSSSTYHNGAGGIITVQGIHSPGHSILIDGTGSGIFTDTQGTGAGGNIFVSANSVMLQNGGTLSAKTSGTEVSATGGTITVDAPNTITMMNRASITAKSEGVANAGSIDLTAMNGFTMQNSTITTQAGQGAGGGNIKVTTSPSATVLLQDNSLISASVADGHGGGGNISIDPQFVILQNSQILAQTDQGQGGAITIVANLFLSDANSIVNADSGRGVNGTVTIQSPNAPISGHIQPLGATPLPATSLLNQRCASLAGGEFSSFTVAGRDGLPTEPGGWLSSPLAAMSAGTGLAARSEGERPVAAGETPLLSLRQIAPPGFLTQAFAVDWSASCQS